MHFAMKASVCLQGTFLRQKTLVKLEGIQLTKILATFLFYLQFCYNLLFVCFDIHEFFGYSIEKVMLKIANLAYWSIHYEIYICLHLFL